MQINRHIDKTNVVSRFLSKKEIALSTIRLLNPIEFLFFSYIIVTGLYILIGYNKFENANHHLFVRFLFIAGLIIIYFLETRYPSKLTHLLRHFFPLTVSGLYFYTETGFINTLIFSNHLDPYLIRFEYYLFGCFPSDLFCVAFPWKWFNELLNFSYFSYYFIVYIPLVAIYIKKPHLANKANYIALFSLLAYYLIFIVFPTAGPQFSYPDLVLMQNHIPDAYIFRYLVKQVQIFGETTTGAFPSSHVGVTVVMLYISHKYSRKVFYYLLPVCILLFLSTVYIRAHYLIDVFGGFVSGFLIIIFSIWCYNKTISFLKDDISS